MSSPAIHAEGRTLSLPEAEAAVGQGAVAPSPGQAFGRYKLGQPLGNGGMGAVYSAWDPQLQRHVAIKLIRPRTAASEQARARFVREAQAMARISHANVVEVYDAGVADGQPFVVMERVEGDTLAGWLKARKRPTAEVLRKLFAAGRGLVAAHNAGLVHRDFKPSNVLIGTDGRVRVSDFGLARALAEPPAPRLAPPEPPSSDDGALTETGVVVGSPYYMAPEQHRSGLDAAVDARADQFAFAVTVHEALVGRRPFDGRSPDALLAAKRRGPPTLPTEDAWLRRHADAVSRALDPDPAQRWPSMRELLGALQRRPAFSWPLLAASATGFVIAAFGLLGSQEPDCTGGSKRFGAVWNEARKAAIAQALLTAGGPHAAATSRQVLQQLDARALAWRQTYEDACRARTPALDRQMACLDATQTEIAAVIEVVLEADETVAARATQLARALPHPERCVDPVSPWAAGPGDGAAQAVAKAHASLARIDALAAAGRVEQAEARLHRLRAIAADHAATSLPAELALAHGRIRREAAQYEDAEENFEEALVLAERGSHDVVAAEAAIAALDVIALDEGRAREGLRRVVQAESLVERAGSPRHMQASVLGLHGRLLTAASRYTEAQAVLEEAVAVQSADTDEVGRARAVTDLAGNLRAQGQHAAARDRMIEVVDIVEAAFGSQHPRTGDAVLALAEIQFEGEEIAAAREGFTRAMDIFERSLGATHPRVAQALVGWGNVQANSAYHAHADTAYQQALEIFEGALGPDHTAVARTLSAQARNASWADRFADAVTLQRRALRIFERALGPEHARVGDQWVHLGWKLRLNGEVDEAKRALRRGLNLLEDRVPPDHPAKLRASLALGYIARSEHQLDVAAARFSAVASIAEEHLRPDHPLRARALYGLAGVHMDRKEFGPAEAKTRHVLRILDDTSENIRSAARRRLARVLWAQHRHEEAIAAAKAGLEELDRGVGDPGFRAGFEDILRRPTH